MFFIRYPLKFPDFIHSQKRDPYTNIQMSESEKQRLVTNIVASLSRVSRENIVQRSLLNFRRADGEYGDKLAAALARRRTSRPRDPETTNPVTVKKRA